jgi:hypothetical protein
MDDRSAAEVLDMVAGESFAFRLRLIMPAATDPESEQHRQLVVADLESRIRTLETADESQFGAFTRVDWLLTALISLLLPFLAWLWLRP